MMRSKAIVWAALVAGTLVLSSCEESASPQHAKAHAPALVPAPTADFATIELPLYPNRPSLLALTDTRPRIDILVEQAQTRFAAAQKEYKAQQFEKARHTRDHCERNNLNVVSRHDGGHDFFAHRIIFDERHVFGETGLNIFN